MKKICVALTLFIVASPAFCEGGHDPFAHYAARYLWVLNQLAALQPDNPPVQQEPQRVPNKQTSGHHSPKTKVTAKEDANEIKQLPNPVVMNFEATTSWALIKATVTDYGSFFNVDVSTDQPAYGWQIKLQSTKEVLLKGSLNGQTQFSFKCERQYIRDYGLTVFIGDNGYPCFLQLFR